MSNNTEVPTLQELIDLTPAQAKAWKRLERAVKDFTAAGGEFYGVLETLSGYNGNHVQKIDNETGYSTQDVHMPSITQSGFCSFADDWHGITLKDGVVVAEVSND